MTHWHSSIEGAIHWKGRMGEQKAIIQSEKVITTKCTSKQQVHFLWIIGCLGWIWGLCLRKKENINGWKKIDEKSCMNNQLGYILVLHTKIQVGY